MYQHTYRVDISHYIYLLLILLEHGNPLYKIDPDVFSLDVLNEILNGFGGLLFDQVEDCEPKNRVNTIHFLNHLVKYN